MSEAIQPPISRPEDLSRPVELRLVPPVQGGPEYLAPDYLAFCESAGISANSFRPGIYRDLTYATHEYIHRPETAQLTIDGLKRVTLVKRFVTVQLDSYFKRFPFRGEKNESRVHRHQREQLRRSDVPMSRKLGERITQLHIISSLDAQLDEAAHPATQDVFNDLRIVYVGAARSLARARLAANRQGGER